MPLVSRTRATLRSAEFGFFGVWVNTRVHTPRRWGAPLSAGVLPLAGFDWRPLRTSCWMVGTHDLTNTMGTADSRGKAERAKRTQPTGKPTGRRDVPATRRCPR